MDALDVMRRVEHVQHHVRRPPRSSVIPAASRITEIAGWYASAAATRTAACPAQQGHEGCLRCYGSSRSPGSHRRSASPRCRGEARGQEPSAASTRLGALLRGPSVGRSTTTSGQSSVAQPTSGPAVAHHERCRCLRAGAEPSAFRGVGRLEHGRFRRTHLRRRAGGRYVVSGRDDTTCRPRRRVPASSCCGSPITATIAAVPENLAKMPPCAARLNGAA